MNAKYDLSTYPTTFDFVVWAVLAKSHGCTHVNFVGGANIATRKYSKSVAWKRFGNILVPICALAGLDYSVKDEGDGMLFPYAWGDAERYHKLNHEIALLKPTYRKRQKPFVTITIRNSFRNKHRDSDRAEWDKFKGYLERIGKEVVVFEDCERAPLDLEYRMSMYCAAEMNFGASGGPMALCAFSEAPYMIFNMLPKRKPTENTYDVEKLMEATGFGKGSQFGFRNSRQLLVWEPDDYENMVNAYELFNEQLEAA